MFEKPLIRHINPLLLGFCSFGLLSIWALPETIFWRHVLLGLGLICSFSMLKPHYRRLSLKNNWSVWVLFSLYLWLFVHLWLFSSQKIEQSEELLSIWARSLAALIIGLAVGIYLSPRSQDELCHPASSKNAVSALLFLGLLSTPLIFISFYLRECYFAGQFIPIAARNWWELPYLQKPPFVVATALLLPLCCALIVKSLAGEVKIWWACLGIMGITLCTSTDYLTNTKNGIAMVGLSIVISSIYALSQFIRECFKQSFSKKSLLMILMAIVLGGSAWSMQSHLAKNTAWSDLISNIKVGMDIDHQNHWKNRIAFPAPPINELGRPVDLSTYERTAWFTAGLRLLKDRPEGFGLIDHSFGWMALNRWPDFYKPVGKLRGMTHSGWLDLALAIGIPGLLLIWIPLWVAWYHSLGRTDLWGTYATLGIPVFFFCYLTTEVIGAHHFVELMMFMTAFFVGITIIPSSKSGVNNLLA